MWYIRHRHIRAFSDAQAKLFDATTANMISVFRSALAIPIVFLIHADLIGIAAVVFVVAVYLDFIDGAVARYQEEHECWYVLEIRRYAHQHAGLSFLRLRGESKVGAWLDPLADKILIQATLAALAWSYFGPWLLLPGLVLAVLLTSARPFKSWLVRKGYRSVADGRANIFGKLKMWAEVLLVGVLFIGAPEDFGGAIRFALVSHVLLVLTIGLSTLSLIFHLLPSGKKGTHTESAEESSN